MAAAFLLQRRHRMTSKSFWWTLVVLVTNYGFVGTAFFVPPQFLWRCQHFCSIHLSNGRRQSPLLYTTNPDPESDWKDAQRILEVLPSEPDAVLPPDAVALSVCRSLQWVDYPTPAAGLERCFSLLTWECRKTVTARQGGDTMERFCQYGLLAPALQVFMGAQRLDFGPATYTASHPPFRGALYSIPVTVYGAPILSVRYASGLDRSGVGKPPITPMVLRLEEQRRPPHQGCWLVKEIMDANHAFDGDLGNAGVGG